jgi:ABC-2 type transport system ATP-binding protein
VSAIDVQGLEKTYAKGVRALDGLTFAVEEGTVFGLLGPNGAGKSTTVKILATLSTPDAGSATVAGLDVVREPDAVRRSIGYVPQSSGVDENLALQGRVQRLAGAQLRRRVDELVDVFALGPYADRVVRGYSGGTRRRLDVAMGLVHRPAVLFLDEPTTGLDPQARAAMWEELERLAGGERLTILLTTHYLEEADRLAERIAIVDRGRVVAEGTPDELKGELRGDAVHVELRETPGAVDAQLLRAALDAFAGVREAVVDGRRLSARADDGPAAVPRVLAVLEREGAQVASVTVARPSLDDVYLRYAGRRFADADGAAGAASLPAGAAGGAR